MAAAFGLGDALLAGRSVGLAYCVSVLLCQCVTVVVCAPLGARNKIDIADSGLDGCVEPGLMAKAALRLPEDQGEE